jgi:hypothetical protein
MSIKNANKISNYLKTCRQPQAIETIRKNTGITHWDAALAACLELLVAGKINGMNTSKSWIFWGKKIRGGGDVLVSARAEKN